MPRFKNKEDALAWGAKMKLAREAKKKLAEPLLTEPLVEKPIEPEVPQEVSNPMVVEMLDIIRRYFSSVPVKIIDRGNSFVAEITVKEGDMRSFVVNRQMLLAETERWCQKIKANMEGKPLNNVAGIELMVGKEIKPLPSNVGEDKEFFFREE